MQTKTQSLFFLLLIFLLGACGETTSETSVENSPKGEAPEATTVNTATEPTMANFVHSVFFYLKEDLTEAERSAFLEGVKSLGDIEYVKQFDLGVPAGTPRDVVDSSYDYNLILRFEDADAQNAYQEAPIHTAFVEAHSDKWTRVQVYDTILE